jgi:hypothetical protein
MLFHENYSKSRKYTSLEYINLLNEENRELKNCVDLYYNDELTMAELITVNVIVHPMHSVLESFQRGNTDQLFYCPNQFQSISHLQIFNFFVKEFAVYDYHGKAIFTKDDLTADILKHEDIFEWQGIIEITPEIVDIGKEKYFNFPVFEGEVVNEPLTLLYITNTNFFSVDLFFDFEDQTAWTGVAGGYQITRDYTAILFPRKENIVTLDDFLGYIKRLTIYEWYDGYMRDYYNVMVFDDIKSLNIQMEETANFNKYSHLIFKLSFPSKEPSPINTKIDREEMVRKYYNNNAQHYY